MNAASTVVWHYWIQSTNYMTESNRKRKKDLLCAFGCGKGIWYCEKNKNTRKSERKGNTLQNDKSNSNTYRNNVIYEEFIEKTNV